MSQAPSSRTVLGGIGDEAAADLHTQIAVHRQLGWRHLELRTINGSWLGDLDRAQLWWVADCVRHAGIDVPCIDSRIGSWQRLVSSSLDDDLAELANLADLATALHTRYVRVMSYPNDGLHDADWRQEVFQRFQALTHRAEQRGIVLLLENCSGWAATSAERTWDLIDSVDSPNLRLLFDIGNPVAHGYDGPQYLADLIRWVEHVHVKDATRQQGGGVDFTLPGQGDAEVEQCLSLLLQHGYGGVFCVEPHLAVLPHEGLRADPSVVLTSYLDYCHQFELLLTEVTNRKPQRPGSPTLAGLG